MRFYRVGGAVRDRLLGRPVKDCDWVVVGGTEEQMLANGFRRVGADFPVFLHPETREEYALARTERKTGGGYKGFAVQASPEVTLEEDLRRRDLTINAMAEDAAGTVIDPYGGRRDLENRMLRHVSPAFVEDPLRVVRVARFAARLDFMVAPETLALMRRMSGSGELALLAPERVWTELQRALSETAPDRFIAVLREAGALVALFPELDRLYGVPQPARFHPEVDTAVHVLMALRLAAASDAPVPVRFAVLVHDLGKGITPSREWPRHIGHEQRGVSLIEDLCMRVRAPREYRELAVLVGRLHSKCHHARQLRPVTLLGLIEDLDAFRRPERFDRFLWACEFDYRGRGWTTTPGYPQAVLLRAAREAAARVEVADLVTSGLAGMALAEQLRERRLDAISRLTVLTGS